MLVLIYLIYSSDFFLISLVTTITGLLMWYYSKAYYNRLITKVDPGVLLRDPTFYIGVVSVLLLIFLAIIVYASSKNSGEIKIGKVSVPAVPFFYEVRACLSKSGTILRLHSSSNSFRFDSCILSSVCNVWLPVRACSVLYC